MIVITAKEMIRLEKMAYQRGYEAKEFMKEAGLKVAEETLEFIKKNQLPSKVTILAGSGNNGGDAFAAAIALQSEDVDVKVIQLEERGSELNHLFKKLYLKRGGVIEIDHSQTLFEGVLLDGLLGIGFKGKIEKKLFQIIEKANESRLPILSIDVPSGLDATKGTINPIAIRATKTIALGAAKLGFFLEEGFNHIGELKIVSFGLPSEIYKKAKAEALVLDPSQLSLPPIQRNRHKYQAGYLIGYAGSKIYSGSAKLASMAALRTGAGIVRIFHQDEIGEPASEVIYQNWNLEDWEKEQERAGALFVGPGLTLDGKDQWKKIKIPALFDASALQKKAIYPKGSILTPHKKELLTLLNRKEIREDRLIQECQKYVNERSLILVVKGAPTWIFSKGGLPIISLFGDPGMATAGSGDVLTGMIGALLAQKLEPIEAAQLGVYLHALAGEIAAKKWGSYSMIASDLIESIPLALKDFQNLNHSMN